MSDVNESVLARVLGDDPMIKIVDTLLDHPSHEYTKTELAEVNDISRTTIYNVWDRIENFELVEESRKSVFHDPLVISVELAGDSSVALPLSQVQRVGTLLTLRMFTHICRNVETDA